MNETELIARQAMEIETLQNRIDALQDFIEVAYTRLVCIGGPFNDNLLFFNKKQLNYLKPILQGAGDLMDDPEKGGE